MKLVHFMTENLFLAVLIVLVALLKKFLRERGSMRFHYQIWFVLLFALLVLALPVSFWQFIGIPDCIFGSVFLTDLPDSLGGGIQRGAGILETADGWQYDFVEMVDSKTVLFSVFLIVWMLGALVVLGFYLCGSKKLYLMRRSAGLPSENVREVFQRCCMMALVDQKIDLLESELITTPLSFGWIHPCIVLPKGITEQLTQASLEHIFLHELMHIKHGDLRVNIWMCAEQILYWFHPFVWWAFSQMRKDREAYCDWLVLNFYDTEEERLCYGETLLQFAGKKRYLSMNAANRLSDHKSRMQYRMEQIADFKKETRKEKWIRHCSVMLLTVFVMAQIPVFSSFAKDFNFIYIPDLSMTIVENDYSDLFGGASGCAVLYDLKQDIYTVYNPSAITRRIAPCSTCKIYSALNALEEGVITTENNMLSWDGINRELPVWNENQDLDSAMANSVNWYFQLLDQISGVKELDRFYKKIGYGNGHVGNHAESYWNGNHLKISPLEQVKLLVKLYRNEFGWKEINVETVKNSIYLFSKGGNRLYGKTGTGRIEENDVLGWFIGYLEADDNTYFFAVTLQADSHANGSAAARILYGILEKNGLLNQAAPDV